MTKKQESYLSKGIGFMIPLGVCVSFMFDFYQNGVIDKLESTTYGGRKVDALFIALTKIGGGEWLPYTFLALLSLYCLYIVIKNLKKHFTQKNSTN